MVTVLLKIIKWVFNATSSFNYFEIQKYYQNEPSFNGVYSRDNLPYKIKDGAYIINLDEYILILELIGLHCMYKIIMLLILILLVEHILEVIKTFINNKNIKTNIFRIQTHDSVMCGYSCIGFIDFMFKGKILTECTNLFSPYDFKKNDNIILSYFKDE